jgi:2-keto-3-deoxy-L-rhamnonate aldolase RhmA
MMSPEFSLLLFSTSPPFIRQAVAAGIHGIIVDWEHTGKETRQLSFDTQIAHDTLDDLKRVRACTDARVICRINGYGSTTAVEIEQAIHAGADEILLPMVRTAGQVQAVLDQIRNRCGLGILVETIAAVQCVDELARLPLSRVYVGLNDLSIERNSRNIFAAMKDGTVEQIRRAFHVPFGVAGLTLPERGEPIPCRLLIGEMARLGCDFSFLRRSFHRDIIGRDLAVEVPRLLEALRQARSRLPEAIARDRAAFEATVAALAGI